MLKLTVLAPVCAFLLYARLAAAQQADIMVGGSVLKSPTSNNASVAFQPAAENGGTYLNISADYIKFRHRLGLNAETSWRYHKADYPGNGETYRPFFSDINALFQPQITKRIGIDIFAGVGVATTTFSASSGSCTNFNGCIFYTTSNHFMEDIGGGVRYYVWNRIPHVFVRPEAHYYHIQNNFQFHSDNVFRAGASIGYTFGSY